MASHDKDERTKIIAACKAARKAKKADGKVVARHRIVHQALATRTLVQHKKNGPFTEEHLSYRKRVWHLLSSLLGETDARSVYKLTKK